MTRIIFALLTVLLAVGIADAQWDPLCPDPTYQGPRFFIPDYNDCRWYYECIEGTQVHKECAEGQLWDSDIEACAGADESACAHAYPPKVVADQDPDCPDPSYVGPSVFIPDYYDCHWYYECAEGKKVHMECAADLYWDAEQETCNFPDETACSHTYTPTPATRTTARPTAPTGPTGPPAPTGPTGPTAPTAPTGASTPSPTARPTDAPLGKLCVGKIDGEILPYPNDCSRYVQCVNGGEYYYKCPRDTYFDRVTAACSSSSPDRC